MAAMSPAHALCGHTGLWSTTLSSHGRCSYVRPPSGAPPAGLTGHHALSHPRRRQGHVESSHGSRGQRQRAVSVLTDPPGPRRPRPAPEATALTRTETKPGGDPRPQPRWGSLVSPPHQREPDAATSLPRPCAIFTPSAGLTKHSAHTR